MWLDMIHGTIEQQVAVMRWVCARAFRSAIILCLGLACTGCADRSVEKLVNRAKAAATEDEWRAWAEQVIERSKTNSTPVPSSEWPAFLGLITSDGRRWKVEVWGHADANTNSPPLVVVVALGGFQSIGIIIGPPTYVEIPPFNTPRISKEVYPGIYVRETG